MPFYLRTGKRLPKRTTEIAIQFKRVPHLLFRAHASGIEPNPLVLHIQPDEGTTITRRLEDPRPADARAARSTWISATAPRSACEPADAYERLLLDAMLGDSTLFTRRDEVEDAWEIVTSILKAGRTKRAYSCRRTRPAAGGRPRPTS